jgi:hypothetical protein
MYYIKYSVKWKLCHITGTKACEKLVDLLEKKQVVKDVKRLSPLRQTSSVEAFHNVIIHFAPKMYSFSYLGMLCRYQLVLVIYN